MDEIFRFFTLINIFLQSHWGKDLFFIFSPHGRVGVQCWLSANFFMNICEGEELDLIANSPQTGVVMTAEAENFAYVNIEMEGDRGQMTNQDLGIVFQDFLWQSLYYLYIHQFYDFFFWVQNLRRKTL